MSKLKNSIFLNLFFMLMQILWCGSLPIFLVFGMLGYYNIMGAFGIIYGVCTIPSVASIFLKMGFFYYDNSLLKERLHTLYQVKIKNLDKFGEKRTKINILPPVISLKKSDFTLVEEYCYQLFETDCQVWEYTDYYALDFTNGQPYYVHDVVRNVGAAYGSEIIASKTSYQELKKHPKCPEKLKTINKQNWQDFIPKKIIKNAKNKTIIIKEKNILDHKDIYPLKQFYFEFHNMHAHHITYLRITNDGYRVFYAVARGWTYGLTFNFDKSEKMIHDIIMNQKFGFQFDAFDRLLSEKETDYIMTFFDYQKCKKTQIDAFADSFILYNGKYKFGYSENAEQFGNLLNRLAEYGSCFNENCTAQSS